MNETQNTGNEWYNAVPWESINDTVTSLFDSLWGTPITQTQPVQQQPVNNTNTYLLYGALALVVLLVFVMILKK